MTPLQIDDLTDQVLANCALSDASHAGAYSVCGLALRLRDLYKWQQQLPPWVEDESGKILEWIGNQEEQWETIEGNNFSDIIIENRHYDPFDSTAINTILAQDGLYYGAGYARSLKPTFFLAVLEKTTPVDGYPVHILGRELARDLATLPALSQDNHIIVRKDAGQYYFWDQLFFVTPSGRKALAFGLKEHGLDPQDMDSIKKNMPRLFETQIDTYIYHELGEIQDTVFDTGKWREIVTTFSGTPVELLARAVKDLLADTGKHGLLRHIINQKKTTALALYAAFIDGLRKKMFPEIRLAFSEFTQSHRWESVNHAVEVGHARARETAEILSTIYTEGTDRDDLIWAKKEMAQRLLVPLGIIK